MAIRKHCRHSKVERKRCSCAFYWDGYIDGRRQYVNIGKDRADARRRAAQIEADRLGGRAAPIPRDATLAAVADRWLDTLEGLGRRPQTLRAYRTSANVVLRYFGATFDVRNIDAREVTRFRDDAFASRRGHGGSALVQALRGILAHAYREGLIDVVPMPPTERRTIQPNPDVRMTEAETEATIGELRPVIWRDVADLVVNTGLRIGEVLALQWVDFDAEAGTLHVRRSAEQRGVQDAPTKTARSTRQIRLEAEVVELLQRQPRVDARIFPRRYEAALEAINGALDRAGTNRRDRGWHSLRHLNAHLRDRARQPIRQAAAELGHGPNFVMTASYGWAAEAAEPAEVAKLRQRGSASSGSRGGGGATP
jgi:integrase